MDAIIERIKEAYNFKTDAEVAKFLGIKPSTLSMQKNRGRLNLKRIIEKCSDLDQNWLLHGRGEKRLVNNSDNGIPIYTDLSLRDSLPNFDQSPVIGEIKTRISDEVESVPVDSKNIIGFITSGDAMAPVVREKDIAFIKLEEDPVDDAIFLISSPEKPLLRRLKQNNESFVAKSENEDYPAFEVGAKDKYQVVGKLVWVLRRVEGSNNL